ETSKNSFTIDMDQTIPEMFFSYKVTGGNKITGWEFTFTVTATDETSGMAYVEFYLNGLIQETVSGPGPDYHWIIKLPDGVNMTIKAIAYDIAGNFNSDEIDDPVRSSNNLIISKPRIDINNYQEFANPILKVVNNR
ncbi:MAG: hypothetical protein JSU91_08495, partial [Thermoplasmatales archaeon]